MFVPMKKALPNKYIFLLLLTITSFSFLWAEPTQVVAHDSRTLGAGSSSLKSFSWKTVQNIFTPSNHPYEKLSKAKEEEVGNKADKKAHNELVAVRKRDGYNLLETRHDVKKKVMSNDMLEASRLFNGNAKRFPLSKKKSTRSQSTSTVAEPNFVSLRQKGPSLGVGGNGNLESPLVKTRKTRSKPTTTNENIPKKAAAGPRLIRSKAGRHEDLLQEPKLARSRAMNDAEWVKKLGIVADVPVVRFLGTL